MADIWLPGYRRHLFALRGKPYQFTHNPKGCLHTTEGGSIAGALSAYAPYPPHLIYDWRSREKVQHIPLNLASYAAMDGNDDDYMVQIELVGFAAESRNWPEQALRNIAEDVLTPIEQAFGVPRKAIWHGFKDGRDGISPPLASTSSPIRLSPAQLRDFSGWLGHQHLPSPDEHWDPGALPIQKIFNYMQEGEDEMSAEAERQIGIIHDFVAVSAKAPNGQTVHDAVWKVQADLDAFKTQVMKKLDGISSGGVDVQALANALGGPLGDHLRDSLDAVSYNALVRALNNAKGSMSLHVSGSEGL